MDVAGLRRRSRRPYADRASQALQWAYGDLDAGFQQADLVLDETFHTQTTSHQPLETRTAMAYWQNGKLYLHCSTQSVMRTVESVAQWVGIKPEQIVVISEYTGGGFGSKIPGTYTVAVPALLAKKIGGPVMMRISREEEHYIGRHRPSLMARVKIGFREDGRVTAVDMFILQDAGPYEDQFDLEAAPMMCSLAYQPLAMRFRGALGPDQHAAADIAAGAGRRTDERDHGAAAREGGAPAGDRRGRSASHQCTVGQGAVWRPGQGRQAQLRHQRVRAAGDRSRRRALPVERTEGAQR